MNFSPLRANLLDHLHTTGPSYLVDDFAFSPEFLQCSQTILQSFHSGSASEMFNAIRQMSLILHSLRPENRLFLHADFWNFLFLIIGMISNYVSKTQDYSVVHFGLTLLSVTTQISKEVPNPEEFIEKALIPLLDIIPDEAEHLVLFAQVAVEILPLIPFNQQLFLSIQPMSIRLAECFGKTHDPLLLDYFSLFIDCYKTTTVIPMECINMLFTTLNSIIDDWATAKEENKFFLQKEEEEENHNTKIVGNNQIHEDEDNDDGEYDDGEYDDDKYDDDEYDDDEYDDDENKEGYFDMIIVRSDEELAQLLSQPNFQIAEQPPDLNLFFNDQTISSKTIDDQIDAPQIVKIKVHENRIHQPNDLGKSDQRDFCIAYITKLLVNACILSKEIDSFLTSLNFSDIVMFCLQNLSSPDDFPELLGSIFHYFDKKSIANEELAHYLREHIFNLIFHFRAKPETISTLFHALFLPSFAQYKILIEEEQLFIQAFIQYSQLINTASVKDSYPMILFLAFLIPKIYQPDNLSKYGSCLQEQLDQYTIEDVFKLVAHKLFDIFQCYPHNQDLQIVFFSFIQFGFDNDKIKKFLLEECEVIDLIYQQHEDCLNDEETQFWEIVESFVESSAQEVSTT